MPRFQDCMVHWAASQQVDFVGSRRDCTPHLGAARYYQSQRSALGRRIRLDRHLLEARQLAAAGGLIEEREHSVVEIEG